MQTGYKKRIEINVRGFSSIQGQVCASGVIPDREPISAMLFGENKDKGCKKGK